MAKHLFVKHVRNMNFSIKTPKTAEGVKLQAVLRKSLRPTTVVGIFDTESGKLSFGAARCHKNDTFCKKVGRERATEVAENSNFHIFVLDNISPRRVFLAIADGYVRDVNFQQTMAGLRKGRQAKDNPVENGVV